MRCFSVCKLLLTRINLVNVIAFSVNLVKVVVYLDLLKLVDVKLLLHRLH